MIVSATELRHNLGFYLELVAHEDIVVMRNGKRVARLTDATKDRSDLLEAITGIVPADVSLEQGRSERLGKI